MARQFPLAVVAAQDHYYCIGRLRLYHWLRAGLPTTAKIPVDVYRRLSHGPSRTTF